MCDKCRVVDGLVAEATNELLKKCHAIDADETLEHAEQKLVMALVEEATIRAARLTNNNIPVMVDAIMTGLAMGLKRAGLEADIQVSKPEPADEPVGDSWTSN